MRKDLVVQLLGVCCQNYNEAAPYLWTYNSWRFSHDNSWQILLRFLLIIGPNARSMIEKIEILLPLAVPGQITHRQHPRLPRDTNWHIKNHPKLRMVKSSYKRGECYQAVWNLWMQERTLRELKLVVPPQWNILVHGFQSGLTHDTWKADEVPMRFLAKTHINVEWGSALVNPGEVLRLGWDVVWHPGSSTCEDYNPPFKTSNIGHLWIWDLDEWTGVL